jgi:hypothetical protein
MAVANDMRLAGVCPAFGAEAELVEGGDHVVVAGEDPRCDRYYGSMA